MAMVTTTDLPFVVKICGITNQEDAIEAIAAGADALGFNFYSKSPRYVSPERARQVIAAVPGAYLRVGVFVNPTAGELFDITRQVPLDVIQLHGDDCAPVSLPKPYRIWRSMAPTGRPVTGEPEAEAYLLDTPTPEFGGSGQTFNWNLARGRSSRVLLAGGLDASNVAEAIRIVKPWGVDACSRLESSPGKKDAREVRAFIRAARQANRQIAGQQTI